MATIDRHKTDLIWHYYKVYHPCTFEPELGFDDVGSVHDNLQGGGSSTKVAADLLEKSATSHIQSHGEVMYHKGKEVTQPGRRHSGNISGVAQETVKELDNPPDLATEPPIPRISRFGQAINLPSQLDL